MPEKTNMSARWPTVACARIAIAFALVAGALAGPVAAQVQNGGFEIPPVAAKNGQQDNLDASSMALTGWTIGGQGVSLVKDFWIAAEGLQSLGLNGKGAGSIAQTVTRLEVGRSYKLRFIYSAHPNRLPTDPPTRMTVRWGTLGGTPSLQEQFSFSGTSTKTNMGWVTAERTVLATAESMALSFTSDTSGGNGMALDAVSLTLLPQLTAPPTLIRAISTSDNQTFLIGRADSLPGQTITLEVSKAGSCTNGALPEGGSIAATAPTTTDQYGYFGIAVSGVAVDDFVTVRVTGPAISTPSTCLASSPDNDAWPKALDITPSASVVGSQVSIPASGFIDAPGKSRWFKFKVAPGQRIQINLSGLPADYDLAVFKDIFKLYQSTLVPADASALTKLSAEYAPSAFTPSAFTPSAFTPSAFTPSAFTPDAFVPSAFTPSAFTPSAFTPSAFTGDAYSPSAFTPSAFTPSAFTPSAFTPSAFTPSAFTPSAFTGGFTLDEIQQAFSSAQTRSILGVSATLGLGNESVVVNTWDNTGNFYVRVVSRGGAYSTAAKFGVTVNQEASTCANVTDTAITPAASRTVTAGSYRTVILTDSSKVRQSMASPAISGSWLLAKLAAFAGRSDIGGVVVDVSADSRVAQLKAQAQLNPACPTAMNLVAQEIKGIVDAYRRNNPVRYIVIAGNDAAVPFFRYPDETLLGPEAQYIVPLDSNTQSEASLRRNYVLNQDAYGSSVEISLRTSNFPVPGLAVGRLVETADEIGGMIDAYGDANGTVVPRRSLVTGYDFLEDTSNAITSELRAATEREPDKLIAPYNISPDDPRSWTAPQLGMSLLGTREQPVERRDIVFLAGHFSANSALAADFKTSLITTDLWAATTDFKNTLVYSVGCHSGYNIVDAEILQGVTLPLDWAQAFAQKQATLVAGTGYQYGDTDFIEYSERIYLNFTKQLRVGTVGQAVPVGEALVKAKLAYLAATPDIRGIHQKALLEATLFGLPMLGVDMPSGRTTLNASGPAITTTPVASGSGVHLGLRTKDLTVAPALTERFVTLDPVVKTPGTTYQASYLEGPDGVATNPVEPVLPLAAVNVTPTEPGFVLRGVGYRGGSYVDATPILPLTGAPATEIRGVHVAFLTPTFYPMRTWTVNYFPALGGGAGTILHVTPAQHKAAPNLNGTTRRTHTTTNLRLYYSSNLSQAALSDAPTIVTVDGRVVGSDVVFTVRVVGDPAAGMQEVWVTYTNGNGSWTPLDLTQCVNNGCGATNDSQLWQGRIPAGLTPNYKFNVHAANALGLVTNHDNFGWYHVVGSGNAPATALAFNGTPPSSGAFGDTKPVSATLLSAGTPVAGKMVSIGIGGMVQVGLTNASGVVSLNVPVQTLPGNYQLTAAFSGEENLAPSSVSAPFAASAAPTTLSPIDLSSGMTKLTATLSTGAQPLQQQAVKFTVTGGTSPKVFYGITDHQGQAVFAPTGFDPGSYTVTARYDDPSQPATYGSATTSQPLVLAPQGIHFGSDGNGLPASLPYPQSVTFTVSSDSGQPVTVGLTTGSSGVCSLTGTGPTYTLTALAPGTCTIFASAGGDVQYADVDIEQSVPITQGVQTINFAPLPVSNPTYGDGSFTISATGGATNNPVTFSSTTPDVCTVSVNTVAIVGAGTCTIAAAQAGDTFYAGATATQTFTVNKKAQAITFVPPPSAVYNTTFAASASSDSGLAVTITASGVCTISGGTVTMTSGTGTCTLTASQAGNGNYLPAQNVERSVAAARAAQTITFTQPAATVTSAVYNSTFTASATSDRGLGVTIMPSGACLMTGSTVKMDSGTGTCTLTASNAGDTNYGPASAVRTVAASRATQTITFVQPASPVAYNATFAVSASSDSGLIVTITPTGVCLMTGSTVKMDSGTGTCTLTASQGGDGNFQAATSVVRTVSAEPASQSIVLPMTITPSPPTFSAGGTFTVATTASSGLPVTYTSLTTGKCTTAAGSNVVTMVGAGLCTIEAYQAGNANYQPTTREKQSVSIGQASQTIVFANLSDKDFGDPAFDLTATASSGQTVTFEAAGSCTVTVKTVRLTSTGSCTITAKQAGNDDYAPAPDVQQSFLIDLKDRWVATSDMAQPRSLHTATRFTSGPLAGQVLIAGGKDASGAPTASTELYNPATGTFTAAGNMPSKSAGHAVVLLPNGKAIVFGGGNSSAQIFDPAVRTWSPAGSMSSNRSYHTATVLADGSGRVLIVGGADNAGKTLNTTIIYNANGTFAAGPNLTTARERHTATLLPNGKVLIAGGRVKSGNTYNVLASTEICDSTSCTAAASMVTARRSHAAILVSGKVLVAGGSGASGDLDSGEIYDPAAPAPAWSSVGLNTLQPARRELTLSDLPNGAVLGAGGHGKATTTSAAAPLKASDLFDPLFMPMAPMLVPRARHTATPLLDSSGNIIGVLVTGGISGTTVVSGDEDVGTSVRTAEVYGSP